MQQVEWVHLCEPGLQMATHALGQEIVSRKMNKHKKSSIYGNLDHVFFRYMSRYTLDEETGNLETQTLESLQLKHLDFVQIQQV